MHANVIANAQIERHAEVVTFMASRGIPMIRTCCARKLKVAII